MVKLAGKKQVNAFAYLLAFTYMASYITRINFGTVISEMETATSISRSLLSLSLTGSFITYGIGQIISGIIGDKFSPKKLVSMGFIVTIVMNLLIPLCKSPYLMLIIWCVNGFAQSLMWPPMVRLMTTLLDDIDYKNAVAKVSYGSSLGTIAIYFISPVLISLFNYKAVFIFSAIFGAIALLVWNKKCVDIDISIPVKKENNKKSREYSLFTPLLLLIMVAIILQGLLRDGITTWMPTYIADTYNFSNSISILTNVIMPIFSIVCFKLATRLYVTRFTNPLTCAAMFFGIGSMFAISLYFVTGNNAILSIIFSALLTGSMHAVNLMLICMLPAFFEKSGNVSTVSGVLNSCTYIGSALSSYGIAYISEKAGWNTTLFLWIAIALLGTAICVVCIKPWRKKFIS
ncbi:MAG: MFS transporter [Clostridia bacterium]|nr:MFS transporter [Clostridia bacterium]